MRKVTTNQPLPMQPIGEDDQGSARFKANAIVAYIADWLHIKAMPQDTHFFTDKSPRIDITQVPDLNCIAKMAAMGEFTREDQMQYAQLIGYSLSGYSELHYVDDASYNAAESAAENGDDPRDAKIAALEAKLLDVRNQLRQGVATLYEKHPDDFTV